MRPEDPRGVSRPAPLRLSRRPRGVQRRPVAQGPVAGRRAAPAPLTPRSPSAIWHGARRLTAGACSSDSQGVEDALPTHRAGRADGCRQRDRSARRRSGARRAEPRRPRAGGAAGPRRGAGDRRAARRPGRPAHEPRLESTRAAVRPERRGEPARPRRRTWTNADVSTASWDPRIGLRGRPFAGNRKAVAAVGDRIYPVWGDARDPGPVDRGYGGLDVFTNAEPEGSPAEP